eukprot:GILJ01000423.1.p1 GENE.GILJ01000423.1~~GILJ01000423.1.p1  ORF type:complete len:482 (-),score=62.60 GILJ01000423.1:89-1534(-)
MALRWLVLTILLAQLVTGLHVRVQVKNGLQARDTATTSDQGIDYLIDKSKYLVDFLSGEAGRKHTETISVESVPDTPEQSAEIPSDEAEPDWGEQPPIQHRDHEESKALYNDLKGKKESLISKKREDGVKQVFFLQTSEQSLIHTSVSTGVSTNTKWPERYACSPPKRNTDLANYRDHLLDFLVDIRIRIRERAQQLRDLAIDGGDARAQAVLDLMSLDFLSNWDIDYLLQDLGDNSIDETGRDALTAEESPLRAVQVLRATLLYMRLVVLEQVVEETFAIHLYQFLSQAEVVEFLPGDNFRDNGEGDHIFNDISRLFPKCATAFGRARKCSANAWSPQPSYTIRSSNNVVRFSDQFGVNQPYQNINGPRWLTVQQMVPGLQYIIRMASQNEHGICVRLVHQIVRLALVAALDIEPLARIAYFGSSVINLQGFLLTLPEQQRTVHHLLQALLHVLRDMLDHTGDQAKDIVDKGLTQNQKKK